jgi:hypothetical protein
VRRVVVDGLAGHRADEADLVRDVRDPRKQLADLDAERAHLLELRLRPEAEQFLALELRQLLALGHALRHGLAVHLGQLGFPVERFQVRGPAGHRQPDHALRLGRMVQRVDDSFPLARRLAPRRLAIQQGTQGHGAQAGRGARQEGAAHQVGGKPRVGRVHGINSE